MKFSPLSVSALIFAAATAPSSVAGEEHPAEEKTTNDRRLAIDFSGGTCYDLSDDPLNEGWTLAMFPNDDESSAYMYLDFVFSLYGATKTGLYINNNGNLSFEAPYYTYTAEGFPTSFGSMVAPFWADVDTRPDLGYVWWKKVSEHALAVTWDHVGYYDQHGDKLNTFQVIISDGTDPSMGFGNNVCFCYGDMQWTTGDASLGEAGFGGIAATVGVNKGDGIDYFQVGRFDQSGAVYDGPYGNNDGIDYLDFKPFCFDAGSEKIPPIITNLPENNQITLLCESLDNYVLGFLAPEVGETTTVTYTVSGGVGVGVTIANDGSSSVTATIDWSPSTDGDNAGITFQATDTSGLVTAATLSISYDCPPPANTPDMTGYDMVYELEDETVEENTYPLTTCPEPPAPDAGEKPWETVGTGTIKCDQDYFCYQLQNVWQLGTSTTYRYKYKFMDCQSYTGGQTGSADKDLSHWNVVLEMSCEMAAVEHGCAPGEPVIGDGSCSDVYDWLSGSSPFVSKCDEIPEDTTEGTMIFDVVNVYEADGAYMQGMTSLLFSKSGNAAAFPGAVLAGPVCTPDPCHPDPCGGGGECTVLEDAPFFQCTCPCEPEEILEPGVSCITCENGGTFAGTCVCPDEYLGDFCEIPNPCLPNNPCQNEGTCSPTDDGTSYVCACPDGFTGFQCQFDSTTACETLRRLVRRRLLGPNKA